MDRFTLTGMTGTDANAASVQDGASGIAAVNAARPTLAAAAATGAATSTMVMTAGSAALVAFSGLMLGL